VPDTCWFSAGYVAGYVPTNICFTDYSHITINVQKTVKFYKFYIDNPIIIHYGFVNRLLKPGLGRCVTGTKTGAKEARRKPCFSFA